MDTEHTPAVSAHERAIFALKEILDAAERAHAGFPIESEEWYARRDFARIVLKDAEPVSGEAQR